MHLQDQGTVLQFTITDSCGNIVSLVSATTVKLKIFFNNVVQFDKPTTFVDRPNGKVQYVIQSGDLTTTGMARMELQVAFNNGNVFTSSRVFEIVEPVFSF